MLSILGFLIMLAPLVVVHELGHFFFAKLFGVKAEAFSVGFGPVIFKRQIGETEWRISLVPFGGYVKLLGEDPDAPLPPEERARSLAVQPAIKRLFIYAGGPIFNFLWAALVYIAIQVIGEPIIANRVGRVLPDSPAEKAGFRSGDEILAINHQATHTWEEIMDAFEASPNGTVVANITRPQIAKSMDLEFKASSRSGFSKYGESKTVGDLEGLFPSERKAKIGISNPDSVGAKIGLKTGDVITEVNGVPTVSFEALETAYRQAPTGKPLAFKLKSQNSYLTTKDKSGTLESDLGIYSSETFVESFPKDSPAKEAGVQVGDRISGIANSPVKNFFQMKSLIQTAGEKNDRLLLSWERNGRTFQSEIKPTATKQKDALLNSVTQYTVGMVPMLEWTEPKTFIRRNLNPFVVIPHGFMKMIDLTGRNFVSISKMFTGDVSLATLGGPILIGKIAGESLERGLMTFLATMGILSIGLGVLNILPVPVLDGGHILLLGIEVIRGKRLTMRQLEVIQTVGLSLIALLMFVVLKNDFSRLPLFN